jgi:hypothetical protein
MIKKIRKINFLVKRFNHEILRALFLLAWSLITIVSLVINLQAKENKIIIIRETKNGDYVIANEKSDIKTKNCNSNKSDETLALDEESLHKVNFIKRYLALIYNFDKASVEDQLGKGTDLMSESFYQESLKGLSELKSSVILNTENMTQSFEVLSITKITPQVFDILGRIATVKEHKNYSFDYVIEIKIGESIRSKSNPWGLEVTGVKETRK